jgi:hypothetical protein
MEIVITFIASLVFVLLFQYNTAQAEQERFREYVFAIKAKDLEEYAQTVPETNVSEQEPLEEIMDLDQVEPEKLLKLIRGK